MSDRAATVVLARPGVAGAQVLAAWLTAASVVSCFAISHLALEMFGFAYETSGGAQWQKIHPATYFAMLAFVAMAFAKGNPVGFIEDLVRKHVGLTVFMIVWAAMLYHIAVNQRMPATAVVDTFLLPALFVILLTRISEGWARRLALFLHIFFAVNAVLGIAEFVLGFRVTPLVANGVELSSDGRSSALLGHPLHDAVGVAVYALVLVQGGGRDMPRWLILPQLGLQIVAMGVFGGRVATVMFFLFAAGAMLGRLPEYVLLKRYSPRNVAAGIAGLTLVLMGAFALAASGFFDLFLMRFVEDSGSAEARLSMLELVAQIPPQQLFFGPDPAYVETLQRLEGIRFGIESFWVAFIAYYGILFSVPFFAGLLLFLHELRFTARPPSGWVIIFFLVICSTSASLSGKTCGLAIFVAQIMLMLRYQPEEMWQPRSGSFFGIRHRL